MQTSTKKKANAVLRSPRHARSPRWRVEYSSHDQSRDERRGGQRDEPAKVNEGDEARVDAAPVAVCEADAHRRAGDALCCLVPVSSSSAEDGSGQRRGEYDDAGPEANEKGQGEKGRRGRDLTDTGNSNLVATNTVIAVASSIQNPLDGEISVNRFPRFLITWYPYVTKPNTIAAPPKHSIQIGTGTSPGTSPLIHTSYAVDSGAIELDTSLAPCTKEAAAAVRTCSEA